MGLFDQLVGGLMGSSGGNSPLQSVLMNMLGGGQQQGQQQTAAGQGMAGGLGGLVATLQQAGLGNVVQSWIGNGPNHPVSPDQLQSALGDDKVQAMSSQAGMAPGDFLSQLSQHLPNVVNGMTPNGHLPDEGTVST